VQNQRAMRIGHTFGLARGSGCVAESGRIVLVKIRIDGTSTTLRQERLVIFVSGRCGRSTEWHNKHALKARLVGKLLVYGKKNVVHDKPAIFCVVGDKGEFIGMQAEVERVYHATDRGDPEVRLEVGGVVPHQGCDTVTFSESGLL
jgi:hypothetical protein